VGVATCRVVLNLIGICRTGGYTLKLGRKILKRPAIAIPIGLNDRKAVVLITPPEKEKAYSGKKW
jgi:hypothetical protein